MACLVPARYKFGPGCDIKFLLLDFKKYVYQGCIGEKNSSGGEE